MPHTRQRAQLYAPTSADPSLIYAHPSGIHADPSLVSADPSLVSADPSLVSADPSLVSAHPSGIRTDRPLFLAQTSLVPPGNSRAIRVDNSASFDLGRQSSIRAGHLTVVLA